METNVRVEKVFQVGHIRYSREKGNTKLTDPRDIYEAVASQAARRLRTCILNIIPIDVIEDAMTQVDTTLRVTEKITEESTKKMLEVYFEDFGVTQGQIETKIQRKMDAIVPAQMVELRKIHNSLTNGMSKPGDWFDPTALTCAKCDAEVTPAEFAETKGDHGKGLCSKCAKKEKSTKARSTPVKKEKQAATEEPNCGIPAERKDQPVLSPESKLQNTIAEMMDEMSEPERQDWVAWIKENFGENSDEMSLAQLTEVHTSLTEGK